MEYRHDHFKLTRSEARASSMPRKFTDNPDVIYKTLQMQLRRQKESYKALHEIDESESLNPMDVVRQKITERKADLAEKRFEVVIEAAAMIIERDLPTILDGTSWLTPKSK